MIFQNSYPSKLLAIASEIVPLLSEGERYPAKYKNIFVNIFNQRLEIPFRVYYEEHQLRLIIKNSTGENKILALCLGTRHCNGFIREECIRQLILIDKPWVVPFVVLLLGEYVIEIIHLIESSLPKLNKNTYREFVIQNPAFITTTKKKIISYWDCYFRHKYDRYQETPSFIAINAIENMV